MVISSAYIILLVFYGIFWLVSVAHYFISPAPTGDRSVGWATGIIYLGVLTIVMMVAAIFWQKRDIGLVVLLVPPVFLAWPFVRRKWLAFHAWLPTFRKSKGLSIRIVNDTRSILQAEFECWLAESGGASCALFRTFGFVLQPFEKSSQEMSRYQERLLATKAAYIRVSVYECFSEAGDGYQHLRKVQPCIYTEKLPPEAFDREDPMTFILSSGAIKII